MKTLNQFIGLLQEVKKKSTKLTAEQKTYVLNKIIEIQQNEAVMVLESKNRFTEQEKKAMLERIEFTLSCIDETINIALKGE